MAARATLALKSGEWFRRVLFVIVAPDSQAQSCTLSGSRSTHPTVRICGASSEEQDGGHTIAKHVGNSPEAVAGYVRDSILADPDPKRHNIRSGSFPSLDAANKLVNSTLARNRAIVDGVANGDLPEQRVDAFFGSVTGIEAYALTIRSQPGIRETYGVGVYIRQDPAARRGYRAITAYPRNLD